MKSNEERVQKCIDETRKMFIDVKPCDTQILEFDRVVHEDFRMICIDYLQNGGHSPANDFLNLTIRYTSIGTEFYLRENCTGTTCSLNRNVQW
jgi:hypothetical protein